MMASRYAVSHSGLLAPHNPVIIDLPQNSAQPGGRKREPDHPAVLLAATVLSNAAEGKDFMLHARLAVMKALHRNDWGR